MTRRHTGKKRDKREGVGLYTYEQVKGTTSFQYFAQIVVGAVFSGIGVMLLYHQFEVRREEARMFGTAEGHFWGWIASFALVAIGVFMAHAGLIVYGRRVCRWVARKLDANRRFEVL